MYPDRSHKNCLAMNKEMTIFFVKVCISESSKKAKGENLVAHTEPEDGKQPLPFLSAVIEKRVTVMKLPISFTLEGYLAIAALCQNPGQAVVLLVDCLTHYKDKLVTAAHLAELYPWGFYNQKVFENIVVNFMKPKKVEWSEIY